METSENWFCGLIDLWTDWKKFFLILLHSPNRNKNVTRALLPIYKYIHLSGKKKPLSRLIYAGSGSNLEPLSVLRLKRVYRILITQNDWVCPKNNRPYIMHAVAQPAMYLFNYVHFLSPAWWQGRVG